MKLLAKLLGIAFFLAVLVLAVFMVWGASFEQWIHVDGLRQAWVPMKSVAWLGAALLLMTDILLPIPSSVVLSGLGAVYGLVLGALAGTLGMFLAASAGYVLGRWAGSRTLSKWVSTEEVLQARRIFDRWGGWAVVLSRSIPILPEVISLMAGFTGMRYRRFAAAVLLGALPTAFLFSYIGVYAVEQPAWGLYLSIGVPAVLWGMAVFFLRSRG